jgi:hypothetical protein
VPEAQGITGELAAQSSRQLDSTEGGLAYATIVCGVAMLKQPSEPHKSKDEGSDPIVPAASSEATTSFMYLRYMCRSLRCMPDDTTKSDQVFSNSAAPAVQGQNKNLIYVLGVKDTRGFHTLHCR